MGGGNVRSFVVEPLRTSILPTNETIIAWPPLPAVKAANTKLLIKHSPEVVLRWSNCYFIAMHISMAWSVCTLL